MRTSPGLHLRTKVASTRVLCPECNATMLELPDGVRIAFRGTKPTRTEKGECSRCGHQYSVNVVEVTDG